MDIHEEPVERIVAAAGEAPHESQRSWLTLLATDANTVVTGVVTGVTAGVATAVAISKMNKPPPPPPPPPAAGQAGGDPGPAAG